MPELPEVEIIRHSLDKNIKQKKVKKVIVRNRNLRIKLQKNFKGTLNLKFLFLIITFLTFLYFMFLSSDCLTISTSGNSGI